MKKVLSFFKNIFFENGLIFYNKENVPVMDYMYRKRYLIVFILVVCLLLSFKLTLILIGSIIVLGFAGKLLYKVFNINVNKEKNPKFWLGK